MHLIAYACIRIGGGGGGGVNLDTSVYIGLPSNESQFSDQAINRAVGKDHTLVCPLPLTAINCLAAVDSLAACPIQSGYRPLHRMRGGACQAFVRRSRW